MDQGTHSVHCDSMFHAQATELTHSASIEMDYGMLSADRLVSSNEYITVCETFHNLEYLMAISPLPFRPTTMSLSGTRENLRAREEY